jgi:hypothetical protein
MRPCLVLVTTPAAWSFARWAWADGRLRSAVAASSLTEAGPRARRATMARRAPSERSAKRVSRSGECFMDAMKCQGHPSRAIKTSPHDEVFQPAGGGGGGGGGSTVKSCANSVTSSAFIQPSWPCGPDIGFTRQFARGRHTAQGRLGERALGGAVFCDMPDVLDRRRGRWGCNRRTRLRSRRPPPRPGMAAHHHIAHLQAKPGAHARAHRIAHGAGRACIASAAFHWVYLFRSPATPIDVRLSSASSTAGGSEMFSM